jgi:hypothetical protein
MHIVEVRRRGAEFGATMAEMRTWLDHHQVEPSLFEFKRATDGGVRFRLQFKQRTEASALAVVFDGEVSGGNDTAGALAA